MLQYEIETTLKTQYQTVFGGVGGKLALNGLDDFTDYIANVPNDAEKAQLCVYCLGGFSDEESREENVIVQAQLPFTTDNSTKYLSVLWDNITKVNPKIVGFTSQVVETRLIRESDVGGGFSGCNIYLYILFSKQYDSCNGRF